MKKNLPLVSIIVASYNHEKYIVECIESIMQQTYFNIELIVVDDCSNDNSQNILKNLQSKYHFKLLINQNNLGVARTRNIGIQYAAGKYIGGCASDDFLGRDKIQRQVEFLENNQEYALCYGREASVKNQKIKYRKNKNYKSGDIFSDLFLQKFWISAGTVLIRKEIFDKVGGYDENMKIEDFDLWLRIANEFKCAYLDSNFYYYRLHGNNTSSNIKNMEIEINKILTKWKAHPLYMHAIERNELIFFSHYARNSKLLAIKKFPKIIKFFYTKFFWIGLLKLCLPKK